MKKIIRFFICGILILVMTTSLLFANGYDFSLQAGSIEHVLSINDGHIYIKSGSSSDKLLVEYSTGTKVEYPKSDLLVITGSSTGKIPNSLWINTPCTVVLRNLTIAATAGTSETSYAMGIDCNGTATVILSGTNVLRAGNQKAGLFVKKGSNLILQAETGNTDSLTATGGDRGSGIGSNQGDQGGSIVIKSGTINATGGVFAAGIGGGDNIGGGSIVIEGGVVNAQGGSNASGIGNGANDIQESITVNGGTVTATGGYGSPGIGNSNVTSGGNIALNAGTISAYGGYGAGGIVNSKADIYIGKLASVFAVSSADGDYGGDAIYGKTISMDSDSCYASLSSATYFPAGQKIELLDASNVDMLGYIPSQNLKSMAVAIPATGDYTIKCGGEKLYWTSSTASGVIRGDVYSIALGMNYYAGMRTYKQVDALTIEMPSATYTYNGLAQTPTPTIKDGVSTLAEGTDYTLSYTNNVNAGTATVTITGIGEYVGTVDRNFTISKANRGEIVSGYASGSNSVVLYPVHFADLTQTGVKVEYGYSTSDSSATVSNWTDVTSTVKVDTNHEFTGLVANTDYYFFVRISGGSNFNDYTSGSTMIHTSPKTVLTMTADADSKTYQASPVTGYKNLLIKNGGVEVAGLTVAASYTGIDGTVYGPSATAPTQVGKYRVTLSVDTADQTGSLTKEFIITKAVLKIGVNNKEIHYGDALPAFTEIYEGFVGGETKSVLLGAIRFETPYKQGDDCGSYSLKASNYYSNNYDIQYLTTGELKVLPKVINVVWKTGTEDQIYNGTQLAPSIDTSATTTMYGGDKLLVRGAATAVGNHQATVEVQYSSRSNVGRAVVANYTLSNASKNYSIRYLANPGYTLHGTLGNSGWYLSDVLVTPAVGYTIDKSLDGLYAEDITYEESVGTGTYVYMKNALGQNTGPVSIAISIDKNAPTIAITKTESNEKWKLVITASDGNSGIQSISYYLSDTAKTDAELLALSVTDWTDNEDIYLEEASFVYAKAKDVAGNTSFKSLAVEAYPKAEPGSNDPGSNDPGSNDPGNDDPGNNDPGSNNPGNSDSGNTESGSDEPITIVPPKTGDVDMMQKILLGYLVIMNLLGLIVMASDKNRAKKKSWRIPEKTLFLVSLLGGSLGTWAGMYIWRHKTKHWYFVIGMPLIFICHIILVWKLWPIL